MRATQIVLYTMFSSWGALSFALTEDDSASVRLGVSLYEYESQTSKRLPDGGKESTVKTSGFESFNDGLEIKVEYKKWSLSLYPGASGTTLEGARMLTNTLELGLQFVYTTSKSEPKDLAEANAALGLTFGYYKPIKKHMLELWINPIIYDERSTKTTAGIDTKKASRKSDISLGVDFAWAWADNFHMVHGLAYERVSGNESETPETSFGSSAFKLKLLAVRLYL